MLTKKQRHGSNPYGQRSQTNATSRTHRRRFFYTCLRSGLVRLRWRWCRWQHRQCAPIELDTASSCCSGSADAITASASGYTSAITATCVVAAAITAANPGAATRAASATSSGAGTTATSAPAGYASATSTSAAIGRCL
jgi:hypothetical protein